VTPARSRRRATTRDDVLAMALAMPGAWADQPWHDDTVVKVGSRIFAFVGADGGTSVTLRCRPEDLEAWRQRYPSALGPAPYMRTKPWNRVELDGTVTPEDVAVLVQESYDCVVERLTKKERPAGWVPPQQRR
jgi:predicted DNA-binding protein (MmcQ/YjbR family)